MTDKPKPRGAKPLGDMKRKGLQVTLTTDEKAIIQRAADADHRPLAEFIRLAAIEKAQR